MNRRLFLFGVLFVACGPAAFAQDADPDPARFEADIRAFEEWDRQNSFPRGAVLFAGSSSIRMWRTAECFPELEAINRGFGGSHISDVIHFVDQTVLKYAPSLVVFYAGDNDIASGKSPQRVADDFQRFVERVQSALPDTRIVYLPIKPSQSRWAVWPKMREANALVEEHIRGNDRVAYVDTATPMLGDDGRPRGELFLDDGLHLNAQGYRLWTELLHEELSAP